MSLPKNYCMSSASAILIPGESLASFPDHYAILGLDKYCTADEVKDSFRKMRAEYFATDVSKYRQLQSAYAVLIDVEARREYDSIYCAMKGILPSAQVWGDHEIRNSNCSVSKSVVMAAVSRIDAQTSSLQEEEVAPKTDIGREEQRAPRDMNTQNWALKHFRPQYEPLIGSRPYHSFIPIAAGYEHGSLQSSRPTYIGKIAAMSNP